jgi:hypothetical protein
MARDKFSNSDQLSAEISAPSIGNYPSVERALEGLYGTEPRRGPAGCRNVCGGAAGPSGRPKRP